MRVAQLGVVIESDGAKRGGAEVRGELQRVGAEAKRTAEAVKAASATQADGAKTAVRATEEQIKAQERATAAANRRLNEERRAAAAAAERAQAAQQAAAQAAEAMKREADAAQTAAMKMAALQEQALRMDAALSKAAAGFGLGETGANRLRSSLTGLLAPVLQTTGSANVLASTLGSLAIGNAATVGILAGLAAIGIAYEALTAQAEGARRKAQEAFQALEQLRRKEQQGNLGDTPQAIAEQTRVVIDAQRKLQAAKRELANAQNSLDATSAKTGINGRAALASEDLARLQQQINASQRVIEAGNREINRLTAEANADYSRLQTERLAGLVRGNAATVAEQTQLRDRLRNLQAELAELTASGANPARRAELVSQIQTITSVYDEQAKAAERVGRANTRAAGEVVTFAQRYAASLNDVQQKLREYDDAEKKKQERLAEANAAIGRTIEARALDINTMRGQIDVIRDSVDAYSDLAIAREQERAVAEARARLPLGAELDASTVETIRAQVREYLQLKRTLDALRGWDGSNPFMIPNEAPAKARELGDAIRDAAEATGQLAAMFGDVGRNIGGAVTALGKMIAAYERLKQSQEAANASKGVSGAASGATGAGAGAGGTAAAVGAFAVAAVAMYGVFKGLADRFNAKAAEQDRLVQAFRETYQAFTASLKDATRSTVQRENDALNTRLSGLVGSAAASSGIKGNPADLATTSLTPDGLRQLQKEYFALAQTLGGDAKRAALNFGIALNAVIAAADQAAAQLKAQQTIRLQQATDDARVALLVAQGRTGEAEAMQRQLDLQRKIDEATNQFDGLDGLAEYIEQLKAVSEAAASAAAAEKQRQREAFGLDLTARRQTLSGDSRGAFVTRQTIQTNSALAEAQQLVAAGTITAEMFEQLKTLLGDEMVQALKDFDEAAKQAKQSVLDDLEVRRLVALGMDVDAEKKRIEIANAKELQGVTDISIRSQILYVQGLEAEARERAKVAEEQRKIGEQLADIDRRKLDVLRSLDPAAAADLEAKMREVDRAKELASATDSVVRSRLEELYALEDTARAVAKMNDELKKAQELATFNASVDEDLLRATGRNFEADVQRLIEKRDNRLKEAKQVGASQETIDKINAWFDAAYAKLIAGTMGGASGSAAAVEADAGIKATTNFASVSDTTALRMLDVQLSQLTVLREIAANGGAGGSGITVQITVTGSPMVAQTPQQLGRDLAAQIVPVLDEYQGRRIGVEKRFTGNPVL